MKQAEVKVIKKNGYHDLEVKEISWIKQREKKATEYLKKEITIS